MPDRDKIMASMEPAEVAQVAMIETQRAIARSVDAAVKTMEGMQTEIRGLNDKVGDVRERVIKIEAAAVDAQLSDLRKDVEILKADKARTEGMSQFAETVRRWMPSVVAIIFVIILFLRATGRLGE